MKVYLATTLVNVTPTTKKQCFTFNMFKTSKTIKEFEVKCSLEWWKVFETEQQAIEYVNLFN